MSNTEDNIFKKLEKIFSFNKTNKTIFVPEELADEIVPDCESTVVVKDETPVVTLCEQPKISRPRGRPKKQVSLVEKKETTDIFDLRDLSDLDPKLNIKLRNEIVQDFASRIFSVFDVAKKCGLSELNLSQITSAYYHMYSADGVNPLKTRSQIANKVYNMDFDRIMNSDKARIVKVKGVDSTYKLSNWE